MATLAVYGPKHPERSGVADYIDLMRVGLGTSFNHVHVSNRDWKDPNQFDYVLYHVGGSHRHDCAFRAIRLRPGPAIIHEHNCLSYYYEKWFDIPICEKQKLIELLSQFCGIGFSCLSDALIFLDEHPLFDRYSVDVASESLFISNVSVAITHSLFVRELLHERYPRLNIKVIPHLAKPFRLQNRIWARNYLGIDDGDFLFGSFGFIGEYKRIESVMGAWFGWNDRPAWAKLLILGERQYDISIPTRDNLIYMDYVEDSDNFDAYLAATDCAIQLRHPTLGEVSGVISRLVANSRPLIISDTDHTAHFNDWSNVVQVRPDKDEVRNLIDAFREVLNSPRRPFSYRPEHRPEAIAQRITEIIIDSGN